MSTIFRVVLAAIFYGAVFMAAYLFATHVNAWVFNEESSSIDWSAIQIGITGTVCLAASGGEGWLKKVYRVLRSSKMDTIIKVFLLVFNLLLIIFSCLQLAGVAYSGVVVSGSMTPTITRGSFLIIVAGDHYKVGDVIAFYMGSKIIVHRIVSDTEFGFLTRGDANPTIDPWVVPKEAVLGRVLVNLAAVGFALMYLRLPPIFASIITFLVFFMTNDWFRPKKTKLLPPQATD